MQRVILIAVLSVVLLSSCGIFSPAPKPTLVPPTPTPDTCSPDNILAEVEELQQLINSFQSAKEIADSTLKNLIIFPILRLQEIESDIRSIKTPICSQTLKETSIFYTQSVITYMLIFMQDPQDEPSEQLEEAVGVSFERWQLVMTEFNNLLISAGENPLEIPQLSQSLPETEGTGAIALNEGPSTVNVRSAPDIEAEVLARLVTGAIASALGKNEAGDWIQVDLDGVLGWVFAEAVTLSTPIEDLPVIESLQ